MAYGLDTSWVASPTDVHGAGDDEWARMTGIPATHPLVGGPDWGPDGSGMQGDAGMMRVLGDTSTQVPTGPIGPRWDNWKAALDPQSPVFWILLFAVASAGLVHFRLHAGPAHLRLG